MSNTTVASEQTLPAEVVAFCTTHGLLAHARRALRLAETHFAPVRDVHVEIETDPETDDEAVVITVAVARGVDEVVQRKMAYTREWADSVELPGGGEADVADGQPGEGGGHGADGIP